RGNNDGEQLAGTEHRNFLSQDCGSLRAGTQCANHADGCSQGTVFLPNRGRGLLLGSALRAAKACFRVSRLHDTQGQNSWAIWREVSGALPTKSPRCRVSAISPSLSIDASSVPSAAAATPTSASIRVSKR